MPNWTGSPGERNLLAPVSLSLYPICVPLQQLILPYVALSLSQQTSNLPGRANTVLCKVAHAEHKMPMPYFVDDEGCGISTTVVVRPFI